jgi:hypothetical protein
MRPAEPLPLRDGGRSALDNHRLSTPVIYPVGGEEGKGVTVGFLNQYCYRGYLLFLTYLSYPGSTR